MTRPPCCLAAALMGTPTAPQQPSQGPFAPQQLGSGGPHPSLPPHLAPGGQGPGGLPRGLEESFVMLGTASVLRPPQGVSPHAVLPQGVSPLHVQALLQQQHQQQQHAPGTHIPGTTGSPQPGQQQQHQQQLRPGHPGSAVQQQYRTGSPTSGPTPATTANNSTTLAPGQSSTSLAQHQQLQQQQQQGAAGPGSPGPGGVVLAPADGALGPGDPGGGPGGEQGPGGGGGGGGGSGLDAKLRAMAQLFEMASTNTQVRAPGVLLPDGCKGACSERWVVRGRRGVVGACGRGMVVV